jgi:hypothetical protein
MMMVVVRTVVVMMVLVSRRCSTMMVPGSRRCSGTMMMVVTMSSARLFDLQQRAYVFVLVLKLNCLLVFSCFLKPFLHLTLQICSLLSLSALSCRQEDRRHDAHAKQCHKAQLGEPLHGGRAKESLL